MTDLAVGGETFNVLIEGDEFLPVVLLCHPLGADLHIWDAQMPELVKHFRVVRYDARGHGGSPLGTGPYALRTFGRDALAILDALQIEKAHIIGVSQGGAIAQWLLINAGDRIERAVLGNTAAQFGSAQSWNTRIVTARRKGMTALVDATMQRWFSDGFAERHAAMVAPVRHALAKTAAEGYASACAALRDMDLRASLHRIKHQVLVVAGRNDPSISAEQTAALTEGIAGAKLVTLETRHISNVEDAPGFTKAVVEFLMAKPPARRLAAAKSALPVARRPSRRRLDPARGSASGGHLRSTPAQTASSRSKPDAAQAERVATRAAGSKKKQPRSAKRPAAAKTKPIASSKAASKKARPSKPTGSSATKKAATARRSVSGASRTKPSASRRATTEAAAPRKAQRVARSAPKTPTAAAPKARAKTAVPAPSKRPAKMPLAAKSAAKTRTKDSARLYAGAKAASASRKPVSRTGSKAPTAKQTKRTAPKKASKPAPQVARKQPKPGQLRATTGKPTARRKA